MNSCVKRNYSDTQSHHMSFLGRKKS